MQLAADPANIVRTAAEFHAEYIATGIRHASFTCPFCGVPLEESGLYPPLESWWLYAPTYPPHFTATSAAHRNGCDGHATARRRPGIQKTGNTTRDADDGAEVRAEATNDSAEVAPVDGMRVVPALGCALFLPDRFLPLRRPGVPMFRPSDVAHLDADDTTFRRIESWAERRDRDYATPLVPVIAAAAEALRIASYEAERAVAPATGQVLTPSRATVSRRRRPSFAAQVAREVSLVVGTTATNYHDAFVDTDRARAGAHIWHGATDVIEMRPDGFALESYRRMGRQRHPVWVIVPLGLSPDQPQRRAQLFRFLEENVGRRANRWFYAYGSLVWRDALERETEEPTGWFEIRIASLDHLHID